MEAIGKYLEKKFPNYFPPTWDNATEIQKMNHEKAFSVIHQTFLLLQLESRGVNAYENAIFGRTAFVSCTAKESRDPHLSSRFFSLSDVCPEPFLKLLLVKGNWNALDQHVQEAMTCLQCYLSEYDKIHKGCVKKLYERNKAPTEREVQAVLACHLFGQLATNSDLVLDQNYNYDSKGCPWCSLGTSNIHTGNTSFGHLQYWHGRGDLIIVHRENRTRNVVTFTSSLKDVESDTDNELDESGELKDSRKAMVVIPEDYIAFSTASAIRNQLLSQTITNGFLACKENKNLEDNFIPCFLASCKQIAISLYNPKSDVLLTQGDCLAILTEDGELNEEMVFQLWLTLNLNLFKQNITQTVHNNLFEPCGFLGSLSEEVQNIYRFHLSSELELQVKPPSYPARLVVDGLRSWEELIFKVKQETGD